MNKFLGLINQTPTFELIYSLEKRPRYAVLLEKRKLLWLWKSEVLRSALGIITLPQPVAKNSVMSIV
jgi:hypothetical protein